MAICICSLIGIILLRSWSVIKPEERETTRKSNKYHTPKKSEQRVNYGQKKNMPVAICK